MSSLELLPFQGPSLSFVAQFITISFVFTVFLVLRHMQESRKRRRVAVWVFDVGRILISYIAAHILLYSFIPFINITSNSIENNNISQGFSEVADAGKLNDKGAAIASQQLDMLTFTVLDIFPGLPLLYVLYTSVLHGAYHAHIFWVTTLARIRFRRDVSSNCLYSVYTLPPPGRDHIDPELADVPGILTHYSSPADTGFVSGNYGAPVRIKWLVQQTVLLTLSIFALRAALFYVFIGNGTTSVSAFVQNMRNALFGWFVDTKNPGHGDYIMHAIILPSVLYSTRFVLADYLLRYRLSVAGVKFDAGTVLPLYRDSNDVGENTHYRDLLPSEPSYVEHQDMNVDTSLQFIPAMLPHAVSSKKTGVVRRTFSPVHSSHPTVDSASEILSEPELQRAPKTDAGRAPDFVPQFAIDNASKHIPQAAFDSAPKPASQPIPQIEPNPAIKPTTTCTPNSTQETALENTLVSVSASNGLSNSGASTLVAPTPVESNIEENIEAFVDDIYGLGQQALTTVKQLPESSEELKQAIDSVRMTVEKVEFQQKLDAVKKTVGSAEIKQKFDAVKKAVAENVEINQALDNVKKKVEAVNFSQVRDNLSLASSRIKPLLFSSAASVGLGLSGVGVGSSVGHSNGSPLLENGGFQMPGLYGLGNRFGGISPRVQTPTTPSASFSPSFALENIVDENTSTLDLGIDGVDTEEEEELSEDEDDEEQESSDEDVD